MNKKNMLKSYLFQKLKESIDDIEYGVRNKFKNKVKNNEKF